MENEWSFMIYFALANFSYFFPNYETIAKQSFEKKNSNTHWNQKVTQMVSIAEW